MSVESATNISQLDPTKPAATDLKSEGDDHIRLIKYTLSLTFPSVTGIGTDASSNSSALLATTSMVQSAILASSGITAVLPAQSGNTGKFLTTNGSTASWGQVVSAGQNIYLNNLYGAF